MDIKIKDFEGPLDLLLHLVSKYQMDIYEVPLIEVIEQYLAYLTTLQAMRLEVAGEYMLMASQLTLIKSRRLLPKIAEQQRMKKIWSRTSCLKSKSTGSLNYWVKKWPFNTRREPVLFKTQNGISL